jgi:hypothetical protein
MLSLEVLQTVEQLPMRRNKLFAHSPDVLPNVQQWDDVRQQEYVPLLHCGSYVEQLIAGNLIVGTGGLYATNRHSTAFCDKFTDALNQLHGIAILNVAMCLEYF